MTARIESSTAPRSSAASGSAPTAWTATRRWRPTCWKRRRLSGRPRPRFGRGKGGKYAACSAARQGGGDGCWGVGLGGDRVGVVRPKGAGPAPRVVATYERGFGFGSVALSSDLLEGFGGDRWTETVLVDGDQDAVRSWAADHRGVDVASGTALVDDPGSSSDTWIGRMVLLAMLGYVLVAVANSLVASTMRRRDEFATLRLIGATPRQIRSMVTRETGVMTVLAVGFGLLVSVVPMSLLGLGIVGQPWPQGPLWLIPAVAVTVAGIGWGATRAAATRALRAS